MRQTAQFATLCLFALLATAEAGADTYLAKWENKSGCSFAIHNGANIVLGSRQTHDFGNSSKDPDNLLGGRIEYESGGSCSGPPPFKLVQSTGFTGKKCAGVDPGPFKITTSYKGRTAVAEYCYCITSLRAAYLEATIDDDRVLLSNASGAYSCTN